LDERGLKFLTMFEAGGRPPVRGSLILPAVPEMKEYLLPIFGVLSEIFWPVLAFGDND
jgi:hypothetical protein